VPYIALCKNLEFFTAHLLRFRVLLLYVDEMLKFLIKDVSVCICSCNLYHNFLFAYVIHSKNVRIISRPYIKL
jgi:hypothetical protein